MILIRSKLFGAAFAALALAGCSNPDFYLMPPPASPSTRLNAPVSTISVAEMNLPSYADAIEMARLTGAGVLQLDNSANWADTPRRALSRHLAAALEARLTARVTTEPWPGFDSPGLRIEVTVDRLVGSPETAVEFTGQYVIIVPESGRIYLSDRFAIVANVQTPGYAGLADAHGRAVDQLADRIATRISAGPTS
jgi:uncharacterized lipoprotein YmbA